MDAEYDIVNKLVKIAKNMLVSDKLFPRLICEKLQLKSVIIGTQDTTPRYVNHGMISKKYRMR